jgi:hypothetical protein
MTVGDFRDEIKLALGENIDDAIWSDLAIEYNIRLAANKLKKQALTKMYRANDMKSAVDMVSTVVLTLALDPNTDYRYVTPPTESFDLPQGQGINYASYYRLGLPPNCPPQVARAQFSITTWRELMLIYSDPLQRPSPQRPRFIPGDKRVYVFGVDPQITQIQMGLYLALDTDSIDPTDVIALPPETMFDLRRIVLMTGNWILLTPNERLQNDGRDVAINAPKQAAPQIVSVNDPILTTPSSD